MNLEVEVESSRSSRLILPVVLLSALAISLGIAGTAIALPTIAIELGSAPMPLQWVVNGFNVTFAAFTLVWGVLSDRIGYRRTFIMGLLLILLGSLLSAAAPTLLVLDTARLIAGIGAAGLLTSAASILSNSFSGAARGLAFALFGTTIGVGLSFGPTISGLIIEAAGWRGIFVAFAAIALFSLAGSGKLPHIASAHTPGEKAIDFAVLHNRRFLALVLVPAADAIGFVTILTYLPTALSAIHGLSAGAAGLFVLPLTLPVLFGPLIAAQLIRRNPRITAMTMIYISLACLFSGEIGLLLLAPGIPLGWLFAPMVLLGFGFGFPIGLVDGEALASVPAQHSGTAAGVLDFIRQSSEALAVGAYAAILAAEIGVRIADPAVARLTSVGQPGNAAIYADSFHLITLAMAVIVAGIAIAIVRLQRVRAALLAASVVINAPPE